MEEKRVKNRKILKNYEKLFHHLHIEFPELTELSSKTLETFSSTQRKKSAVIGVIKKKIEKAKKQTKYQIPYKDLGLAESLTILKEAAQKCPATKMSRFEKKNIRNSIAAPHLTLKYEEALEEMLEEVQEEYSRVIHAVAVRQKIKNSMEIPGYFDIKPYKHVGRTENYKNFVQRQKDLESVWMLHQPLHRLIIQEFNGLPDLLVVIERGDGDLVDFQDLEYEMQKNLFEARRLMQDFYWKIEIVVQTEEPKLKPSSLESFFGCCTCAVSIQLSQIIINTLNHVVNLTKTQTLPSLHIYVTFDNEMEIFPTPEQTSELFQCLIKDILALPQNLKVLHNRKLIKNRFKPLPIYITQEFVQKCMRTVDRNIDGIYQPLTDHLKRLNNELKTVYSDLNGDTRLSDLFFEEGCEKIRYFTMYYERVCLIPQYQLFDNGLLILTGYISKLQKGLNEQKQKYFKALASQSYWEFNDIFESFQLIRTRAKIDPLTTEQTIEIGKYMNWVKSEYIQEATERIGESLLLLASLLQLGVLDDDQLDLNVRVIKELDEMEPIVLENLSMFEQLKFEAEEKLQKQIENVNELTRAVHPILCLLDDMDDILNIRTYLAKINRHLLSIKHIETQIDWINTEEVSLSFPKSSYPEFEELKNYVYPFFHLLKLSLDVHRNISVWLDGQFDLQSYDETKVKIESYHQELTEMYKSYRKKIRQAQDENLQMRFKGTVDDPDVLNWPAPLKISSKTIKMIEDFQPCLSLMKIVCNQSLRSRHWKQMSTIAGIDLSPNAGSTLRKLLTYDLKPFLGPLEIISQGATHEQDLLDIILEMKKKWLDVRLKDEVYKDTDLVIFSNLNSVVKFVEENMEKLLILSRSAFARPHKQLLEEFSNDMLNLKNILISYGQLEEKFFHLLPFFTFVEENEETLEQTEEFNRVKEFKKSLYKTLKNENIFDILKKENILEDVQERYKLFENIYYGVKVFLDTVRSKFPRFYFISNEELIEILSNINLDHSVIEKYMIKSFIGISEVVIRNNNIVAVRTLPDEHVDLMKHVEIDKKLVNIFTETEKEIKNKMIKDVSEVSQSDFNDEQIVLNGLGQVLFVSLQIFCTSVAYKTINNGLESLRDLKKILENYKRWFKDKEMSNSKKRIFKSLVTTLTQNEEFIEEIYSQKVTEKAFAWLKKFKYHLENNICVIRSLNSSFIYGYEYYGIFFEPVNTPHTERSYVSLLCAYMTNTAGTIHGGPCSGKTETFKNLAVILGVYYRVISCTNFLSYDILERFLRGCHDGQMWLCLDEMNKIDFSLLSLLSDRLERLNIGKISEGPEEIQSFLCMTLSADFPSIFDLPMTFKSKFRSICAVPVEVCRFFEIKLIALGFENAKYLSRCVQTLFKTFNDVLTGKFYDFSLKLFGKILKQCENHSDSSSKEEKVIVVRAVSSITAPMLSEDHKYIFENLTKRIFNLSSIHKGVTSVLTPKIVSYLESNHLFPDEEYINRINQVAEALTSKQTVIVLGDIFTGKTKAISALYELMVGDKESLEVVNPSVFTYEELYGLMDNKYDLWKDGILTRIFRKFSTMEKGWLLFDSPIESSWVDTLHSILEGEKIFTLGSGDFMRVKDSNSIIFEVDDLKGCSPSLISRCSLVYFEASREPWKMLVKPWIKKNYNGWTEAVQNILEDLMVWMIPPLLKFIEEHCSEVYKLGESYLVKRTVDYIEILLKEALFRRDEDMKNVLIWVQASMLLGIYNGLTATLTSDSRVKFDAFFKQLAKNQAPQYPLPDSIEKIDVNVPTEGLFSEYFYIYKGRGTFKYSPDTLKNEKVVLKTYIDDLMVPTTDTMRTLSILDMFVKNNFNVILTGPTGTAKTLCINHFVHQNLDKTKYSTIFLKFIPRMTSKVLQTSIEANFLKNTSFNDEKTKKKSLIVIEDLNIVTMNDNKVSSVVEFLRQTVDHQFCYDAHFGKKILEGVGFIATMGVKGGLYKTPSKRLLKNFDIFKVDEICEENMVRIFSNVLQVEWKKNGFAADIALVTNSLVNATFCVYEFCLGNFKASPLKFSYCYNIWDFLKILRGLFLLKKESADSNKKIFFKLWVNECSRVFGDRLLDPEERNRLCKEIMIVYELHFKECFSESFNGVKYQEMNDKLIFSNLTNNGDKYEETDVENLKTTLEDFTRRYQLDTGVKLVLSDEVLPRIIKISRILSIKNSHCLFLGVPGTGRNTLIKLTSFIHGCKMFDPQISYTYDEAKWHETLKNVLLYTGGRGKNGVLYLNEEHLIHKFILEDLNFFLKNGDIIDLFQIEEEPSLLNMVRLDAQGGNPNFNISSQDVYQFFVERCKTKLHVFLSLNCKPIDIEMRTSTFQSLAKYCTPVWFEEWSGEALMDIASKWIENCNIQKETQAVIPKYFVKFFNESKRLTEDLFTETGKELHVTTKTYVEFLQLYIDIIEKERCSLGEKKEKYMSGLRKLRYADDQIKKLEEHLCAYQLQLRIMSKKAGDMTRQIARETLDVEKASDLVKKDEKIANKQAEAAAILKADCEIDLAQAIPILEDAIQALNTLKPPDITLVKSMKNPPDAIKLVMAAVCVIKDVKPDRIPDPSTGRKLIDYWGPSKRILGDMNFLQSLKDFDKDHIKTEIMVKIRKDYLSHKDFKPNVVAKASSAAEGLCKWIIAMDMYDKVAKEVAPKKEKLEKAEREYAQTLSILEEKKLEVVRLEKQLAQLNIKLEEANKKQSRLQRTADACNRKLERSVILINGFEDEKIHWTNEVLKLERKNECLCGDVLLTSAFIAYLSAVPLESRKNIADGWFDTLKTNEVPVSDNWDLTTTLISNNISFEGLPLEKYFFENSIIHSYSQKFSILVDPHGLAKAWITKTIDKNTVHYTKYLSNDFIKDVKYSLKTGKLLIIDNFGYKISCCLNPILTKSFIKKDKANFITFENEDIEIHKNFNLIMITPFKTPNYRSEASNKIRIIDFSTTTSALQKKLLSLVIKTENPLVSKHISIYKKKQKKNEKLLKEYQESILKTLSNAEADLLEDNKTLKILDHTKYLYKRINQEIYLPDKVVPAFEELEKNYTEFSHYASKIFLCIEDFMSNDQSLKFSYKQFLVIFRKSILEAPLSASPLVRIENITRCFTYTISRQIGRTLSPQKCLNFLYQISCCVLLFKEKVSTEELQFIGKRDSNKSKDIPINLIESLKTEKQTMTKNLNNIDSLEQLEAFKDLKNSVKDNKNEWMTFLSTNDPENHGIPNPLQQNLTEFQKFLLLQTLRPDRTEECLKKLVSSTLGEEYIKPIDVDLEELYSESFCLAPILFQTTSDKSPISKIKTFASRKKFNNKFFSTCICEGDNEAAEHLIRKGQSDGLWVCILNCHLSKTWKYNLEKICEVMTFENTHENFRLWLISNVSLDFPSDFLNKCVRVVYTDSDSFKQNILVSYKDFVDDLNLQEYQNYWQKTVRLLYRLVCLHNVFKWRLRFKGLSWNVPFKFGDHDLKFALKFLPNIIKTYGKNDAVNYLIGELLYCGQFSNKVDYNLAHTLFVESISLYDAYPFKFPSKNDTQDFLMHITDKLPAMEKPEYFGVNEAVLFRKNVENCSSFNLRTSTVNSEREAGLNTEHLKEIIEKSLELIHVEIQTKNNEIKENLIQKVLESEIRCHNKLKENLKKYLRELDTILTNDRLFSPKLKMIVKDLMSNKIPKKFLKYSFITDQNYSSFVLNLKNRLKFFKDWRENGTPGSFWISAFYHPKAIINAQKIQHSQRTGNNLTEFSNTFEIENRSENSGFKIHGMFMVNGRYNKDNDNVELLPEGVYFEEMPPINIIPMLKLDECSYNFPVYRNDTREDYGDFKNLIFSIMMKSDVSKTTLTKLGTALVCEKPNEF